MAPRNSTNRYHSPSSSSSSSSAHRHEQPLPKDASVKENETNVRSHSDDNDVDQKDEEDDDDKANQIYALGVMGSSSKNNGDLSPTSTMNHQRTNTNGDMKNGIIAQDTSQTFYVDSGDADAIVATTNDLDGEEGSIRAGVVCRTYKRRWFGLVQLTLLNIIVSWVVSITSPTISLSRFPLLFFLVEPCPGLWILSQTIGCASFNIALRGREVHMGQEPRTVRFIYLAVCFGAYCSKRGCLRATIVVGCNLRATSPTLLQCAPYPSAKSNCSVVGPTPTTPYLFITTRRLRQGD